MQLGTAIIIILVIAWALQFAMSYFQMRRFYKRVSQLRKDGVTSIGMSGSMYKRRIYGVLTVDKTDKILHDEQLSGWTVFASLKPVKDVEGLYIKDIMDDSMKLSISKKLRSAFQNSFNEIEKARKKAAEAKIDESSPQKKITQKSSNEKSYSTKKGKEVVKKAKKADEVVQ
jgi:DNA-binding transcriptional regulator of glucitol operon